MEWPELDALLEEMQAEDAERWQAAQELRKHFEQLQPQIQVVAQQYETLQVQASLQALNDRLLSGMGTVELVHSGVGIEFIASLVWPAYVDPRGAAEESAKEGLYRIEVWLGPGMQDGQPRIRISGEKRLEAKLPTSTERFRAALISVFRNPRFAPREAPAEAPDQEPDGEQAARSDEESETVGAMPAASEGSTEAGAPEQPSVTESEAAIPMGPPAEPSTSA